MTLLSRPILQPLGDAALLVRFADTISEDANRRATAFAARLDATPPEGVVEVAPGLVSILLRMKPGTDLMRLSGELRLLLGADNAGGAPAAEHSVAISFDGEDLAQVAATLFLPVDDFIAQHNATALRVLAVGFAPGFVYCGFHPDRLVVPRREQVRPMVPAGTVLFAAGQTAITATPIRTGWHVIGHTPLRNFDPAAEPPVSLVAGDRVQFVRLS